MLICGIPGKTRFTINGDDVRDEARRLGLVSISYHAQNRNRDIDECVTSGYDLSCLRPNNYCE